MNKSRRFGPTEVHWKVRSAPAVEGRGRRCRCHAQKECKRAIGYRPTATDVFTIVAAFRETWSKLDGKTPVTLAALNEAGNKAVELLAAVGVRENAPVSTAEAARTRQKAFTLFAAAYEDAQRAVDYLRFAYGDADDIAPTFYNARGPRRRPRDGESPGTGQAPSEPPTSGVEESAGISVDNSAGLPVTPPFSN